MRKNITPSITNRESETLSRYFRDISKFPLLTADEEIELPRKIKAGDMEARDRMITGNLRFVVSVAKQYQGQGLSLDDLIEEGNIGLNTAVERFDETMGFKFSTYAVHWIEQSMRTAIVKHGRTVRLPVNKRGDINKIKNAATKLEQQLSRTPTEEEIAESLGFDIDYVLYLTHIDILPRSIDAPVSSDSETTMEEILVTDKYVSTDRGLLIESMQTGIAVALKHLPEGEAQILRLLFGIDMPREYTETEAGELTGLSRERVRQIKEKAIKHLKKNGWLDFLRHTA